LKQVNTTAIAPPVAGNESVAEYCPYGMGELLYVERIVLLARWLCFCALRFAPLQCVGPRERNGPRLSSQFPIPSQEAEEL